MTSVLKRNIWTQTRRGGHVKTEAETGVIHLEAKEQQGSPATSRTKEVLGGPADTLFSDFKLPEPWDNAFLFFFLSLFMLFVGFCYSKLRKLTHICCKSSVPKDRCSYILLYHGTCFGDYHLVYICYRFYDKKSTVSIFLLFLFYVLHWLIRFWVLPND